MVEQAEAFIEVALALLQLGQLHGLSLDARLQIVGLPGQGGDLLLVTPAEDVLGAVAQPAAIILLVALLAGLHRRRG